jgi:transposase
MWTVKNRGRYDRGKLRYPSDLTDAEWELVEPLIPPGKRGGGKRTVVMREVVNGLMYVLSTGCQWRAIPKDLPPKSTLSRLFRPVGLRRHVGSHSSRALCGVPGARRTGGQTHRRHHRQSSFDKLVWMFSVIVARLTGSHQPVSLRTGGRFDNRTFEADPEHGPVL